MPLKSLKGMSIKNEFKTSQSYKTIGINIKLILSNQLDPKEF